MSGLVQPWITPCLGVYAALMHPPRASTQPSPSHRWPCTSAATTCSRGSLLPRPATTTAQQKTLECLVAQSSSTSSPSSILRTHPAGPAPLTASVCLHPKHQNSGPALHTSVAPASSPVTKVGQRACRLRSPTGRTRVQVEIYCPAILQSPPISISLYFSACKTEQR